MGRRILLQGSYVNITVVIMGNQNKFKFRLVKNIYIRQIVVILAVVFIPLVLLSLLIYNTVENKVVNQKMNRIDAQNAILKTYITSENYMEDQNSDLVETEISQLSNVYNGRIQVINKDYVIIKDTFVTDEGKFCLTSSVLKAIKGEKYFKYDKEGSYMEFAIPLTKTEEKEDGKKKEVNNGAILVVCQIEDIADIQEELINIITIFFSLMLLVTIGVAVWSAALNKRRLDKISKALIKLGNRDFDVKLNIKDNNATMQVSEDFNKTVEDIKRLDETRSQFVSNVSHELKTPITSMKILADSLVGQENMPVEIYQEFMEDIAAEIDRENKLITDLLEVVKLDKKTESLNYERININELIEATLKRLAPIAKTKNVDVIFESFRPVIADVDEIKFGRVLTNLIENAIKYNVDDGRVRVTLNSDHKYFFVNIEDTGVGIPEEDLELVFERFFRVDKARNRETGGNGLGLSIVRNIVTMHDGEIKVHSKENEGSTFSIRIPLYHLPEENIEEDIIIPLDEEEMNNDEEDM